MEEMVAWNTSDIKTRAFIQRQVKECERGQKKDSCQRLRTKCLRKKKIRGYKILFGETFMQQLDKFIILFGNFFSAF